MKPISYQECYEILSLPSDIQWEQANQRYRKMVQRWHPDRYEGDDTDLAQRRFIELTTAFNKLRDYHQAHKCLPFSGDGIELQTASNDATYQKMGAHSKSGVHSTHGSGVDVDASITHHNRQSSGTRSSRTKAIKIPPVLLYFALLLVAGGLVLMLFASLFSSELQEYKEDEQINFASELYEQPKGAKK